MPCRFYPDEHKYVLDGTRVLPNVTRILDASGLVDHFGHTDDTRERGRFVHRVTQQLDANPAKALDIDYRYEPYVTAYRAFVRHMQPEWSQSERVVFDATYGYAGTLDRAGLVQGVPVIVDIKTGEVPPSVGPQTAAYRRCLHDAHRWQRACLQLRPDGQFRWLSLADRTDDGVFLAALTLYQWREKHRVQVAA